MRELFTKTIRIQLDELIMRNHLLHSKVLEPSKYHTSQSSYSEKKMENGNNGMNDGKQEVK